MVAYEVSALDHVTRLSQAAADLRKPAQFGCADVFWAECDGKRVPDTRYVVLKYSGSAEEYVTDVSTSAPACFTRISVQGLCRIQDVYRHEAWWQMSAEAPLFSIFDDKMVLSTQPPASIRVELNGRQLADGQELKLQNKSVIEVRYAEVVNRHCDPYKRWMVLFSAQYLHGSLGGRGYIRHQTQNHTRDPVNTLTSGGVMRRDMQLWRLNRHAFY
jgi:hypothetical protein